MDDSVATVVFKYLNVAFSDALQAWHTSAPSIPPIFPNDKASIILALPIESSGKKHHHAIRGWTSM